MAGKRASLSVLAVAEIAAFCTWFSATAVLPSLRAEVEIGPAHAALFTSAVQAGFVVGTIVSALLGLADRLDPRRYFAVCAFVAAAANGMILLFEPTSASVIVLRFVTGAMMAGVYPVGMKIAASWADNDLGLLIGMLVGALTLGSAAPHLANAFGGLDWRPTIVVASIASVLAGLIINLVGLGPKYGQALAFHPRQVLMAWRDKPLRYANGGYLGHMWELFAMWAWLGVFFDASFRASLAADDAAYWGRLATFGAMGIGGLLGALAGGYLADRIGRTALTMGAMALSGGCALITGFLFGAAPWLVFVVAAVWGIAVIADSAQFSASVSELCQPDQIGTMLTVQTCAGFLLTLATIHLVPTMIDGLGWGPAFAALAIGPFIGVWSMAMLRRLPEARRMAGGRR